MTDYRNWYQYWGHCCLINDLGSSPQPKGEAHKTAAVVPANFQSDMTTNNTALDVNGYFSKTHGAFGIKFRGYEVWQDYMIYCKKLPLSLFLSCLYFVCYLVILWYTGKTCALLDQPNKPFEFEFVTSCAYLTLEVDKALQGLLQTSNKSK